VAENVVVRPREGKAYWMIGGLYELKASAAQTGGEMVVFEMTLPPGPTICAPPHAHSGGEAVYVLEGKLRWHIGDETRDVGAGSFLYFKKGEWEWFENPTSTPARVLIVYGGRGMDEFFAEAAQPAARRELPPPPDGPPDMDRLMAIGKKH